MKSERSACNTPQNLYTLANTRFSVGLFCCLGLMMDNTVCRISETILNFQQQVLSFNEMIDTDSNLSTI